MLEELFAMQSCKPNSKKLEEALIYSAKEMEFSQEFTSTKFKPDFSSSAQSESRDGIHNEQDSLIEIMNEGGLSSAELSLLCISEIEQITREFVKEHNKEPISMDIASLNQMASEKKLELISQEISPDLKGFANKCLVIIQLCSETEDLPDSLILGDKLNFALSLLQTAFEL